MNQQEMLPTLSIFAGPTHSPIDQCISRSNHGLQDRPTSAPTRREKKAAQVSSCLSVADTWFLQWHIRKMAESYYLPISLSVFLRLTSPICHNPDLLHRRLSGGLLISIRPSP